MVNGDLWANILSISQTMVPICDAPDNLSIDTEDRFLYSRYNRKANSIGVKNLIALHAN